LGPVIFKDFSRRSSNLLERVIDAENWSSALLFEQRATEYLKAQK